MAGHDSLERLGRMLVPVIAVLLLAAGVGVVTHDGAADASAGDEAATATNVDPVSTTEAVPDPSAATSAPPSSDAPAPESTSTTTAPLGRAATPTPGVYRYEIDSVRDGTTTSRAETREISILDATDAASVVQVVAESDGERQVSVFDWSPAGAIVRTTRFETASEVSRECLWDPPFIEFGALEADATWTVGSRCTTDVAGLETVFEIFGGGGVAGEVVVVHAGADVRVWQVDRTRTTVITAVVGDESVEQRVEEVGTFFVDPVRGLVLRSDVTVMLSGAQQGETRRTSVLVE